MEVSRKLVELAKPDWMAEEISFRQCKLGDSVEDIPQNKILDTTRLDIALNKQAEFSKLTLNEKINLTINNEGWVQTIDGINFRVSKKVIVQFGLFKSALTPLGIKKANEVLDRFGLPDSVNDYSRDGQLSETEYFYSGRQLLVVWSHALNQMLNINIGPKYVR